MSYSFVLVVAVFDAIQLCAGDCFVFKSSPLCAVRQDAEIVQELVAFANLGIDSCVAESYLGILVQETKKGRCVQKHSI